MKIVCYARVSQDDLHCENQKLALDAWLERNAKDIESHQYLQEEESSRKTRPIKEGIIKDFRAGKFDTVVVVQIFRFARSMIELVQDVEGIVNQGGRFISINDGFDFQKARFNASAQLQLSMFAAFAQFERELIRERTIAGVARAKAQGKARGRHPVGCGCGFRSVDGKVYHNGPVKPVRDEKNVVIGWKQTSPVIPIQTTEGIGLD